MNNLFIFDKSRLNTDEEDCLAKLREFIKLTENTKSHINECKRISQLTHFEYTNIAKNNGVVILCDLNNCNHVLDEILILCNNIIDELF